MIGILIHSLDIQRMDADESQLKNMEERNANLERDVKKYEERQKIEREVTFCRTWLIYQG